MIDKVTDPKKIVTDELVPLRTENSKTFDLGNGKRQQVISIGSIHYKDNYANKSEQWKDIDLTWEGNRITKAPYELRRDGAKFTFKDKKSGEVSTLEPITLGLKPNVIPEFSAVRFQSIPDKLPFEARFRITGKVPLTRAYDDEGEIELETSVKDGILTEKLSQVRDKGTRQIRPAKGNIRIDPTWQVGASSDDCYRRLTTSSWSLTYTYQPAGASESDYQYGGGMRFTTITIPKGATITAAHLTLRSLYTDATNTVNTRISAEKVNDAPTFADDAGIFDTRWANRTTARVDWDNIPAWTSDTDYNSPEIKTIIQEIINRGGWSSGNDIVIFWEDFDDRSTHAGNCFRRAYSYDGSTTYPPKLVVTYTTYSPASRPAAMAAKMIEGKLM